MFSVVYVGQRTRSRLRSRPRLRRARPPAHDRGGDAAQTGTCLVSVWGEVDLHTAPQLERVLDDATRAGDQDVLVEFSRDSFIDSTGLRVSHPRRPALAGDRPAFTEVHDRQPSYPQHHRDHGPEREAESGGFECGRSFCFSCFVTKGPDTRTLLFFTSTRSGPARRMESLLTALARRERGRLKVVTVDIDASQALAAAFAIFQYSDARLASRPASRGTHRGQGVPSADRRDDPGSSSRGSLNDAPGAAHCGHVRLRQRPFRLAEPAGTPEAGRMRRGTSARPRVGGLRPVCTERPTGATGTRSLRGDLASRTRRGRGIRRRSLITTGAWTHEILGPPLGSAFRRGRTFPSSASTNAICRRTAR